MKALEMQKLFQNPPQEYRMLPLFRVNDEIEEEEVRWQIRSLREKGFGGVFSICEVFNEGAPGKFLSDWWWKAVDIIARACRDEGMEFWVYDDEDWPSGALGGQLFENKPDWNWHYLKPTETAVPKGGAIELSIPERGFIGVNGYRIVDGKIDLTSIIDLSPFIQDGCLSWQAPGEGWTVAVYAACPGKGFFIDGYGDLMNREAMAEFVRASYGGHWEHVKKIEGLNFKGYFTDEPACSLSLIEWGDRFDWFPSMAFTPELPEAFRKLHGYDWLSHLPLLYHDDHPESLRFRCHHWETCCHLYSENYFRQIYDYCESKGKISSGHLVVEENFLNHLAQQGGNLMTHFRHMHIPGIDWIHPFENPLPSTTPKYAVSIAHLEGKERVWCETFAASGWGLTFQEMRRIVNWEHINGISMQIPICYKYSLRGPKRATFFNPGIGYQQPCWEHMRPFADYEARLCALTAGGGHVAQIALAYGSADIWALCHRPNELPAKSERFNQLGDQLRYAGYDFDILDEKALLETAVSDSGMLKTATEDFECLVFCGVDAIRNSILSRAFELAKSGGKVLFVHSLPKHSYENGSHDPETRELLGDLFGEIDPQNPPLNAGWKQVGKGFAGFAPGIHEALCMLQEKVMPDVVSLKPLEKIVGFHKKLEDAHLYLLFNPEDRKVTGQVSLGACGQPVHWNPENGEAVRLENCLVSEGRTILKLTFQPYEICPILLHAGESNADAASPMQVIQEIPMPVLFDFRIEETMANPHLAWNFTQREDGWTSMANELIPPSRIPIGDWSQYGLAAFSGLGHYSFDLEVEWDADKGDSAFLDLGRVAVSAETLVNGESAGIVCFAPWRVDVSRLLRNGCNHFEVIVANTLSNYYSQFVELAGQTLCNGGDLPERRVSGWIGPARLEISKPE